MGEVGEQGPAFHREVGRYAAARGITWLWTAGQAARDTAAAFGDRARAFDTTAALIDALPEQPKAALMLVKGSRFMKMETVVAALQAAPAGRRACCLAWPNGCRPITRNSAFCACSSTSPSAR